LIAFAWSWVFWLPEILWDIRLFVAPFGPFVAAFFLTYLNEGENGVRSDKDKGQVLKYHFFANP